MSLKRFIHILCFQIPLLFGISASNIPDSTHLAIKHLHDKDSTSFYSILNTISKLAGRDAQMSQKILFELEEKVNTLDNHRFLIETLIQKAQNELLVGIPDSALKTLQKMESIISPQDTIQHYSMYYLQGWVASEMNNIEEGKAAYLKGLDYAKKNNNPERQIQFLDGLATCTAEFEDRSVQLEYLEQAKKIAEEHNINNTQTYYSILYNLAGALQTHGQIQEAIDIYKQLSEIYTEENYLSGLAAIANNLAHVYKEEGNYKKAVQEIKQALYYDKKTGTKMYILSDYITFAKIYKHKGDADSTIHYYNKADSIAIANKLLKKRHEITFEKANAYKELKQYQNAYYALLEHIAVRDSFNIVETKKQISELENHYELIEVEMEKEQLAASLEKEKRLILFQTAAIILMLIVVIAFAYNLIDKRKTNAKIRNLNNQLHFQNSELKDLNESKDKFFSIVSHDLRGPIGQLKELLGYISTHKEKYTQEQSFHYLDIAAQQLDTTYEFIENLLLWSRSQANKSQIKREKLSLEDISQEATKPLLDIAHQKNITLTHNIPNKPIVIADKNMLTFIIRNIVSNALKFTHSNGKIEIIGLSTQGKYELQIKDNGVGMSSTQINNLFIVEEASSTKGTKNEKGTGLGLILCKEFADKNHIDISTESIVGKGSMFTLTFSNLSKS